MRNFKSSNLHIPFFEEHKHIIDQIIDCSFSPDYTLYYEEIAFDQSRIKKNHYVYPVEQVFSNLDLVEEYLGNWKYND